MSSLGKAFGTIALIFILASTALAQQAEVNWMSLEEAVAAQQDEPRKIVMDVYTQWCGPCKMIAPILEEVASEYNDRLKICKIDVDANQETPPKYGIRGIPTLMLFKNGEVEATKVGALSKSQLQAFLDSNI